jgi:enamine deaminase RidA (YjgF/YER057c/UK114 family)
MRRVGLLAGRLGRADDAGDAKSWPGIEGGRASYANIVKIVTFVVGYKPELRPIIGQARSAFFEGMTPPASTPVGVSALAAPEWLIEIEAVAVVD